MAFVHNVTERLYRPTEESEFFILGLWKNTQSRKPK
jgi:hypothetical protein